jgi:hypothetical protein
MPSGPAQPRNSPLLHGLQAHDIQGAMTTTAASRARAADWPTVSHSGPPWDIDVASVGISSSPHLARPRR